MQRKAASQAVIPLLLLAILTCVATIQPVRASGLIYIRADGSIDPPTAPILRNGDSYTLTDDIDGSIMIEKNNTIVDGADHTLQGAGLWETGIDLSGTTNVTISNIKVDAFDYGIYLYLSNHDTVSRTSITSTSLEGIYIYSSSYDDIDRNNITTNAGDGIYLFSSSNNSILENNIASNTWGISSYYSSGNSIFHNNFLSNSQQANIMESTDFWDIGYPSGGNYWNDYSGTDHRCGPSQDHPGGDGVGDTPYVIDGSNKDNYPLMNPWTLQASHNVAVISVVSAKTVIGQGFSGSMTVYGANKGEYSETFNVSVYANTTSIGSMALPLESGSPTNSTLAWNTTGFAKGNYTLSAYAWPVSGETDTSDNSFTGGWVVVSMVGDLTGASGVPWPGLPDGKVDGKDLTLIAKCFGSWPGAPPPMTWTSNADINDDGKVDGKDLTALAKHFGESDP